MQISKLLLVEGLGTSVNKVNNKFWHKWNLRDGKFWAQFKEMGKDVFCLSWVWNKEKIIWRLRIFLYPMLMIDEKDLSLFLFWAQNLPSLLFNLQTRCYGHCWSQQFAGHMSYELCNRPCSPQCLCGWVVEHQSTESEGKRFDSS